MHNRIHTYMLISISLIVLTGGCVGAPLTASPANARIVSTAEQPSYWPGDAWRVSSPEEQGIDSASILSMLQEIRQKESEYPQRFDHPSWLPCDRSVFSSLCPGNKTSCTIP